MYVVCVCMCVCACVCVCIRSKDQRQLLHVSVCGCLLLLYMYMCMYMYMYIPTFSSYNVHVVHCIHIVLHFQMHINYIQREEGEGRRVIGLFSKLPLRIITWISCNIIIIYV